MHSTALDATTPQEQLHTIRGAEKGENDDRNCNPGTDELLMNNDSGPTSPRISVWASQKVWDMRCGSKLTAKAKTAELLELTSKLKWASPGK